MKQRFNALDLKVALFELRKSFTGCRVTNVYDVDHKTYLIKLAKPDSKAVILIESGIRIHSTEFEMPKNIIPSGFSMKLRKHIRSRRLEKVQQVGADRIVDMQFGSNEAAYHLIIELYDRGNILLTDFEYTIITVLRPRTDADSDVKFTVREKYPLHLAKQDEKITFDKLNEMFANAKPNDDVKRLLTQNLTFGASLVEHCMSLANLQDKCLIGKSFDIGKDLNKLYDALIEGEKLMDLLTSTSCEGIIVQKMTKAPKLDSGSMMIGEEEILVYDDFIPYLFKKFEKSAHLKFENFDRACDEFFSKLETQKIEMKESQQNREAIKKLENVKKDHQKRLEDLKATQSIDEFKAKLIEYNLELVDQSIFLVNSALANQLNWNEIKEIIDDAKEDDHAIALAIKQLKLEINHIILELNDPEDEDNFEKKYDVEIDLGLTAFKNSRKYYEMKKSLAVKEQKTLQASDKALKSAEKRTMEILKQASKNKTITKARKQYWFEKFYWFISSENYLVIGGRDQQQNEIVVKKYLKQGDIYVHADLNGASSVVIKNPTGKEVSPKTLNEAGCMAVCYSVAWEAKVLANAWWVYHHQVSKQAPTGEYIGTGSFMIRGKKNYLISSALVFGFGLMYKLDDASIEHHLNDRRIKTAEEEQLIEDKYSNVEFEEAPEIIEETQAELEAHLDYNTIEEQMKQSDEKEEINEKNEKVEKEMEEMQEEEEEEENFFPDTQFEMKAVLKLDEAVSSIKLNGKDNIVEENEDYEDGDEKTNIPKESTKQQNKSKASKQGVEPTKTKMTQNEPLKRGQKTKLNKMKTKYKDQDDEDRELIMKFMKPDGASKKVVKTEEKKKPAHKQQQQAKKKPLVINKQPNEQPLEDIATTTTTIIIPNESNENANAIDADQDDDTAGQNIEEELNILNSLTGIPLDEDEILFCIPVCAPYNCIQNYKHKVKLNPGTTKRGQAVKTALEIFQRDKTTSAREKDMIKSMKDQDVSRNMPGKVKVSAPNLMKLKKK